MTTPGRRRRTRTTVDHANLANLDAVSSGHTGFASDNHAPTILTPVGFAPADIAFRADSAYLVETTEVDQQARAVYLGRIGKAFDTATVAIYVVTAAVFLEHGEVAICIGMPGVGAAVKLTRLGYANAVSAFEALGPHVVSVTFSGAAAGDHVWLAWVQKADAGQGGTLATFDLAVADHLTSGMGQFAVATRLSTMGALTQFGILAKAVEPLWAVVGMENALQG